MAREGQVAWTELLHRLAPLLPAERFERLRRLPASPHAEEIPSPEERRELASYILEAIRDLDSLYQTLVTYLPRYVLDLSPTPGEPHGERVTGSFIFADVTGFTALTGELSKRGTAGREEMNRLMRDLFSALIDPLLTSGGDLLIFAGDAILAYFPAYAEGRDSVWATRTALRLVQAIEPFAHLETPYGTFSLTMSAGVERGDAFAAVVGSHRRMELLISGGPVQGAMQAEGQAEPGQVFVGPGARPFLPDHLFHIHGGVVDGLREGELDDYEPVLPARRRRRATIFSRRISDLLVQLERALEQVETLTPFIPPDLFAQIVRREDIRQHPPVAIQFVNLVGIEELALGPAGPELATAVLQRYFVQAQEIVSQREGIISQVDPYARGFTLLNPFGAPTHHEGIPRLAAAAALELGRLAEQVNREFELDPPLTQRIGQTYDRIFTGEIGNPHRREYVVAGPAVNLAARLMSKAGAGQIVLDPSAWNGVQEDFLAEELEPIPLKGIPRPVPRFNLRGLQRGKSPDLTPYPLVGREQECAALAARLAAACEGEGSVVTLAGETGIGKTRLVTALISEAQERGMAVLTGHCRTFGRTMPYLPWADMVGQWFRLDEGMDLEERRRRLREQLARFDLVSSLPAFADLLGLPPAMKSLTPAPQPDTPPTGGLFARLQQSQQEEQDVSSLASLLQQRVAKAEQSSPAEGSPGASLWDLLRERASIPHALQLLLQRQAEHRPTLIVLEDVQWMDPDSRAILEALLPTLHERPLFLLITAHPETETWGEEFDLAPLEEEKAQALAGLALRAKHLAPELAGWLTQYAGGNPLFLLTYCRALRDAEAVVVDAASGTARWSGPPPQLPVSLQELLLAQVNQLNRESQEALQRGSVIGDLFPDWLLASLYGDACSPEHLAGALERAARHAFISPPPPERIHLFSNIALHNAVYETLSHSLRRAWHERLGDALAEGDERLRYERLEQMAHHYSQSENAGKAARFTRLAGDKARARQADEAALAFYGQTLAVEGDHAEIAAEQRRAHEGVGDIRTLQGEPQAAHAAYQAALEEAPPESAARLRAKMALLVPLWQEVGVDELEEECQSLPRTDALYAWLGAAQVWLLAGRGEEERAIRLARDVAQTAGKPVSSLLHEALDRLPKDAALPSYEDLIALFARTHLRHPPGERS